jgi:DNA-binding NtrC family response regulator
MNKSETPRNKKLVSAGTCNLAVKSSSLINRGLGLIRKINEQQGPVTKATKPYRILLVGADIVYHELLDEYLRQYGFKCYIAPRADIALEFLKKKTVDLVITDVIMPGMNGLKLAELLMRTTPLYVILMPGYKPSCSYKKAVELGASDLIDKPSDLNDVLKSVKRVLNISNLPKARMHQNSKC